MGRLFKQKRTRVLRPKKDEAAQAKEADFDAMGEMDALLDELEEERNGDNEREQNEGTE
jgi:hypothetical protein